MYKSNFLILEDSVGTDTTLPKLPESNSEQKWMPSKWKEFQAGGYTDLGVSACFFSMLFILNTFAVYA